MSAVLQARLSHADRVLDHAIERSLFGTDPISIVKSPPGAGKTFLVECAAAVAVGQPAMRVVIVTPGVSQLYDIAKRLLEYRLPRLELAHATHRVLPHDLVGRIAASSGWNPSLNAGRGVVVTNVHLLASYVHQLGPRSFDLMIVDEAYQLAAADFLPVSHLATRILMVGDPGQLDPVTLQTPPTLKPACTKFTGPPPPMSLIAFRTRPSTASRRHAVCCPTPPLVQASFYPDLPFQSVVNPSERRLRFAVQGLEPGIDRALDAIAGGQSLVAVTVPGTPRP